MPRGGLEIKIEWQTSAFYIIIKTTKPTTIIEFK